MHATIYLCMQRRNDLLLAKLFDNISVFHTVIVTLSYVYALYSWHLVFTSFY